MKVEGPGSVRATQPRRAVRSGGAESGEFARELARAGETGSASPATSVSGLAGILAAQEVDDPTRRSRRARARAASLLDRLDEIRVALLTGVLPAETLDALRQQVASARDQVSDPRLQEVLDEIDLRAQVELAKLEVAREAG